MKKFIIYSIILHLSILLLAIFNAKFLFHKKLITHSPLLVDFVKIGEKSEAPKLAPISPEETKAEAKLEKKSEDKPQPKEEKKQPKEEKLKEEPKKEEQKPIKEEPIEKKEAKVVEKKKPKLEPKKDKAKPEAKKETNKPKKAQINLKKPNPKNKKTDTKKSLEDVLDEINSEGQDNENGINAEKVGMEITASEIDALREKIYKCWIVPAGAKGAKDLIVDVDMQLSPDGRVLKAQIVNQEKMKADGFFRIAAESALRAVLDPRCSPLPLPPDKYEQWKNLTFSFNPKDMF